MLAPFETKCVGDNIMSINKVYTAYWGTAVAQWLRCCATNRKVAG